MIEGELNARINDARSELFILTLLVRDGVENGFNNSALELQCTRAEDALEAVKEACAINVDIC